MYEKVKAIAEDKGLTIAALEKKAGVANGTIGKWRNSNGPTVATLEKLAKALGVDMKELL